MCSIFGIGFFRNHRLEDEHLLIGIVSRLFREAEAGGRDAAGLSIMREKSVHILRRPLSGSQLVATDEYLNFMRENIKLKEPGNRVMSIIGHCRLPTQGRPENNLNNHPQVINNIIGVHNGIIVNDRELFESFEKVIVRKAEVDTEIIFQLISYFSRGLISKTVDAIQKAAPYLAGGFACGMQNIKHPYNLYIFRHSNPAKILCYNKMGLVLFATREHYITSAFEEFVDVKEASEPIDLLDNQGIVFNLWNHTSCTFLFKDKISAVGEELKKHAG